VGDTHRDLAILGDPTLRLHVLRPPADLKAERRPGGVRLDWRAGDPGSQYLVYLAGQRTGPFTNRLTAHALDTGPLLHTNAPKERVVYLVRACKLVVSGSGSYTNLSQGIFAEVAAEEGSR
jgi:hypothetical protein